MSKVLKVLFSLLMVVGLSACKTGDVEKQTSEKIEEKEETKDETKEEKKEASLVGKWEIEKAVVDTREYSLEELKGLLSEEQYNQLLMSFEFTDKDVTMYLNGNSVGTTGYHKNEDGTYSDETNRLNFVLENGVMKLTNGKTTMVFKQVEKK